MKIPAFPDQLKENGGTFVPDAGLDDDERCQYHEFLNPVRGLDGEIHWPVDELEGGEGDDEKR
jgi:hypothetical protein